MDRSLVPKDNNDTDFETDPRDILLMLQKSGEHQLMVPGKQLLLLISINFTAKTRNPVA